MLDEIAKNKESGRSEGLFPFTPRWFSTPRGRLHYVDEGRGDPIVFVHGLPTWSFLWREFVRRFSTTHRAIAIDHLGFGRSDKPREADYHPRHASQDLSDLIAELGLESVTLVVHDFGGPIGLGHAIRRPETVARVAVLNTWMWSLRDHVRAQQVDRFLAGVGGYVAYRWFNLSTRMFMPRVLAPGHRLPAKVHRAYIQAAPRSIDRAGQLGLARNLVGASAWYDELWQRRQALADKPMALIWGQQDPTFGEAELKRWSQAFPHARVHELAECGHFPPEEAPAATMAALESLLAISVMSWGDTARR